MKCVKIFAVFIFSMLSVSIYAEVNEYLKSIPIKDPGVKVLWDSLYTLNEEHKYFEAFPLLLELEQLAEEKGELKVYGYTLENLGALYIYKGELEQAKKYFLKAYDAFFESGELGNLSLMKSAISNVYQKQGIIDTAIYYSHKAEELLKHTDSKVPFIFVHNDLGVLYDIKGQFDSSYYHRKLVLDNLDPKDSVKMNKTNLNLASCFIGLYDYDKADGYLQTALEYTNAKKYPHTYANTLGRIGQLESVKGNSLLAEEKLKQCISILEKSKNSFGLLFEFYPTYADVLIGNHKYEEAEVVLRKAEEFKQEANQELMIDYYLPLWALAIQNQNIDSSIALFQTVKSLLKEKQLHKKVRFFDLQSKHYKLLGDDASALASLENKMLVKDTLRNILNVKAVENLEIKYDSVKKDAAIVAANTRIRLQRTGLIIGSIMLLSLIVLLIRNISNRRKIIQQNSLISKSLSDKEILLREIHHRVKNNLQVISSLLSIQSRSIKNAKAKEAILEGKARVHSMSLIHQDLYKKDNLTGVRMDRYLGDLTRDLLDAYNVSEGKISLNSDIEPLKLDVESVIPLGLIVNELMSNALKYAFPEDRDGTIHVVLKEEQGILYLKVADNGIGLNQEQLKTKRDSFGHTLIRAFKSKLDAEIDISANNGTIVSLKIGKYRKVV